MNQALAATASINTTYDVEGRELRFGLNADLQVPGRAVGIFSAGSLISANGNAAISVKPSGVNGAGMDIVSCGRLAAQAIKLSDGTYLGTINGSYTFSKDAEGYKGSVKECTYNFGGGRFSKPFRDNGVSGTGADIHTLVSQIT